MALVNAARWCSTSSDADAVLPAVCASLCEVTKTETASILCTKAGGVDVLVGLVGLVKQNRQASMVCSLLGQLAGASTDAISRLGHVGGVEAAVGLFKASGDVNLVTVLDNMTFDNTANQQRFGTAGGVELMVQLLDRLLDKHDQDQDHHDQDQDQWQTWSDLVEDVQVLDLVEDVCQVLYENTWQVVDNIARFGAAGGIQVVLRVVQQHHIHQMPSLLYTACNMLYTTTMADADNQARFVALNAADAMPKLVQRITAASIDDIGDMAEMSACEIQGMSTTDAALELASVMAKWSGPADFDTHI